MISYSTSLAFARRSWSQALAPQLCLQQRRSFLRETLHFFPPLLVEAETKRNWSKGGIIHLSIYHRSSEMCTDSQTFPSPSQLLSYFISRPWAHKYCIYRHIQCKGSLSLKKGTRSNQSSPIHNKVCVRDRHELLKVVETAVQIQHRKKQDHQQHKYQLQQDEKKMVRGKRGKREKSSE